MLFGGIIIGGFSIYVYKQTYSNILSRSIENRRSYLDQVQSNLEQKIRTVEYSFSTYSTTTSLHKIIDKSLTYKDFRQVKDVTTELSYIRVMGIENTNYGLINLNKNWEIRNGSLKKVSAKRKETLLNLIAKSDAQLFWRVHDHGIQMLVSLPFFESEREMLGTADIDKTTIEQIISDKKYSYLGILSSDHQLLFQNQNFISKDVKKQVKEKLANNHSNGHFQDSAGNVYIYSQAKYNNWTYITRLNHSQVVSQISTLAIALVVITLIIIALLYIVAYMIAEHSTKPIMEIRERLAVSTKEQISTSEEEIGQILGGIDKIVSENELLNKTISYQKPELENLFILNLYRDYVPQEEISNRLSQFGYSNISNKKFITVLIQIDDYGHHTFNANDILLMAIENIVSTIVPAEQRLKPVLVNKDTQATTLVFTANADIKKAVLQYCNQIQQATSKYLKIKISLGISNVYEDLKDSKASVDNAKEALHFRINLGEEAIIFYDEIATKLNQSAIIKYPANKQEMMDAIRAGDKEAIEELFPKVINQIFVENTNPLSLKTSILRLVGDIIQLGQLLGLNFELSHGIRHIYYDVITIDNQNKLIQMLYISLVDPIVNRSSDRNQNDLQSLSDKVIRIVHTRYDEDISLDIIADELHYNANYLSSVFKKEFGANFSDYLQNYRIEISKKWLVETNMTVKEISNKLCYNNPQNFIRFFKKRERITPGAYRHRYKSS
ncbi:helix-turn-helix transcriptional regulator [Lapidilactobacillus bayanensis]|uniref:helix-turn-helix transcriptional regulator n=1 Tax=Lapidilactobacillus bayanensis TaxID=2485998 RepID=UPI000F76C2B1|nr:helix-turn-helix domain-containing protein [Lapidilactobacillus bayanensis]